MQAGCADWGALRDGLRLLPFNLSPRALRRHQVPSPPARPARVNRPLQLQSLTSVCLSQTLSPSPGGGGAPCKRASPASAGGGPFLLKSVMAALRTWDPGLKRKEEVVKVMLLETSKPVPPPPLYILLSGELARLQLSAETASVASNLPPRGP